MLSKQQIEEAVGRLVAVANSPSRIIVFGSYGRGDAAEDSDLDLLVVERQLEEKTAEYLALRSALGRLQPGIGIDLLVCSEDEFQRRSSVPGSVYYWALKEGEVYYEAAH